MKEKAELPPSLLQHIPWESGGSPIWPASSFVLRRNLEKYLFPPKMSESQAHQTLEITKTVLLNCSDLVHPVLMKAEATSPLDKEFIFEHFLCADSFQNTLAGQGFIVDDTAQLLVLLNIQDHLQFHIVDSKGNWEGTWNRLSKIETALGGALDYAYSSKFGYLTSNPSGAGTALTATLFLHVPALIHCKQLEDVVIKQKDEEVSATDMQGTTDEYVGDILVLRNLYTLGLTEDNILHSLQSTAMKLIAAEQGLRMRLQQENNSDMKDQVSRAYGLLLYSYQLQTKEALSALSLIKLGIDLGWVGGITDSKLNEIFFKCRRAHLAHNFQEKTFDPQDLSRKRAEFIHQQIQGIQLKT